MGRVHVFPRPIPFRPVISLLPWFYSVCCLAQQQADGLSRTVWILHCFQPVFYFMLAKNLVGREDKHHKDEDDKHDGVIVDAINGGSYHVDSHTYAS